MERESKSMWEISFVVPPNHGNASFAFSSSGFCFEGPCVKWVLSRTEFWVQYWAVDDNGIMHFHIESNAIEHEKSKNLKLL